MKTSNILLGLAFLFATSYLLAQESQIQYSRPWNKDGINVFEPSKQDAQPAFTGFKLRIGGSFTQDYQGLNSYNKPTKTGNILYGAIKAEDSTSSKLHGFNLAMANLNFDFQIEDGIRVCLENYMSSRHHSEFWVKGGYIQVDKLPMFGNPEWFTKYFRVKIGHFQPNFGDMQFRRTDGGNAIFNPYVENYILDAFTTEIGSEVYAFPAKNFMIMAGMTSGFISGNIVKTPDAVNSSGVVRTKRNPSIFAKAAYDNTSEDFRFRLSASVYNNPNSSRNTLYAGDRTGSHYFGVMEPATIGGLPISIGTSPSDPKTQAGPNFTSGRFNPDVANRVMAFTINPFIKYKGLEVLGAYETVTGSVYADVKEGKWLKRNFNQLALEANYRFLKNESAYIGGRFINMSGEPRGVLTNNTQANVKVNRTSLAAGWFPTKNLLLKGELVNQTFKDFPSTDYRYEGKFKGFVIEAVVGF